MIALNALEVAEPCPACASALGVRGWYMPGMRLLAKARCSGCDRDWFVDLPAGQGQYSPMLLDPISGAVHDRVGVRWFADWLATSYRDRSADHVELTVERHKGITRPVVLLNCIDTLYGHALLKLLNAQQYLDDGAFDVIVMVQPMLATLVPSGVAETWLVDMPLEQGTRWSDVLAHAVAHEVERIDDLRLAPIYPHPHPTTFSIERFSRVSPFKLKHWRDRPARVTFVWRDDRAWRPAGRLLRLSQTHAVTRLFERLRRSSPDLDAAIVGIGRPGGMPGWIADLRAPRPSAVTDRTWLDRYATSHLVIGIHGSNMILPTAHAGGAIELLPQSRAGNFLQDIVFNGSDACDLFFRYRFVPDDIAPEQLASLATLIIERYPDFDRLMGRQTSSDPDVRH